MTFSEPVYYKTDKMIRLKEYATDKLVENINVSTIKGMDTNVLTFSNTILLKTGVRYYIDMNQSTFLDYSDNAFAGILNKNVWNFTVAVSAVKSLEDLAAAIDIYPNPANNRIIME